MILAFVGAACGNGGDECSGADCSDVVVRDGRELVAECGSLKGRSGSLVDVGAIFKSAQDGRKASVMLVWIEGEGDRQVVVFTGAASGCLDTVPKGSGYAYGGGITKEDATELVTGVVALATNGSP